MGHPERVEGKARKEAGLTQEELSFRAGLFRLYISQLDGNLKSPTVATLFRICDALEVSTAYTRVWAADNLNRP